MINQKILGAETLRAPHMCARHGVRSQLEFGPKLVSCFKMSGVPGEAQKRGRHTRIMNLDKVGFKLHITCGSHKRWKCHFYVTKESVIYQFNMNIYFRFRSGQLTRAGPPPGGLGKALSTHRKKKHIVTKC
jgi:hypothetical protein